ncbi:MAG: acetylxylan esterase, partial [Bacteroidetes bacterium]
MREKKWISFLFALVCLFTCMAAEAQFSRASWDSIRALTQTDYEMMLDLLGIDQSVIRPGPSGNPADPDAANTDEALATTYDGLPDPLVFENGDTVRTMEDWEARRKPEMVELFNREIYGRVPGDIPDVDWEVIRVRDTLDGPFPVKIKELRRRADNTGYPGISVEIELVVGT